MKYQLKDILEKLAREYAPRLLEEPAMPAHRLARRLADHSILVITGYPHLHYIRAQEQVVQQAVALYTALYELLVEVLFTPSQAGIKAYYYRYDDDTKLALYFQAAAAPVIKALAGFVSPYVARRQSDGATSDAEILALINRILDKLGGDDLEPDKAQKARTEGTRIIKQMLAMPLRQFPLIQFDEAFLSEISKPQPPPPPDLPQSSRKTKPFTADMADDNGPDQPDFLRGLTEQPTEPVSPPRSPAAPPRPAEPAEPPPPPPDSELNGDTGPQPRAKPPGKRRDTGSLRSPLPYFWDEDNE